jgi:hypothetical protein
MLFPFPGDIADKIERWKRDEDTTDWRDLLSAEEIETILLALRNDEAKLTARCPPPNQS